MSTTETKVRHTPGPWHANVWTTGRRTIENDMGLVIAEVHPVHEDNGKASNARVIAAAPDMLEALEYGLKALQAIRKFVLPNVPEMRRDFHEEVDAMTKAITKARGGAPSAT